MAEVDEAIRKKDPTGGRGLNGHIAEKLDENNKPEQEVQQADI